jgi:hypothetical protein
VLNYWNDRWDMRPAECPCDIHFVDWLDQTGITDSAIYHFGTGSHHHVGIACADPRRRNAVLGITAAPQEHATFVDLAIKRPEVLRYYNVVFGDIYLANARLLPDFDVVTLFHLCECRSEKNDAYNALTDLEVARLLTERTHPGGHILFFPTSYAFDWDRPDNGRSVVARWEAECPVERVGPFKSLLVYRKLG